MTIVDQVRNMLAMVKDAGTGRSVLDLGWFDQIRVEPPKVVLRMTLPDFAISQRDRLAKEARELLSSLEGISQVQIEVGMPSEKSAIGQAGHGQLSPLQEIPGVKKIIAVSSGKGGVGKSTVAVNLACALAQQGLKVGLLDADIYGPNTPIMLGVAEQTPEVSGSGSDQKIVPIESFGISMISMGLLIDKNQPVIWRGPMLNGIIRQFLFQATWGQKDVLVVDLPPGTGDAQLSLAQAVPMTGVVIVTTPQIVSLEDSRRGLAMFRQMDIPVLGVVENMTAFVPPDAPDKSYEIFGKGGGKQLAMENEVLLLAQIPMEMLLQQGGDLGHPIVDSHPNSLSAKAFRELALKVLKEVEKQI